VLYLHFKTLSMARKITVDLSQESWLTLSERQFEAKKRGEKAPSLSKMVADMVDKTIQKEKASPF
jgi:hypothetical protein